MTDKQDNKPEVAAGQKLTKKAGLLLSQYGKPVVIIASARLPVAEKKHRYQTICSYDVIADMI